MEVSDIVKYSNDYSDRLPNIPASSNVILEIETLGNAGLRFRHCKGGRRSNWERSEGFEFEDFIDTAGAGDWLTAGLLHLLANSGRSGLRQSGTDRIRKALEVGQGLSGLNCQFEGARGMMYALKLPEVEFALSELVDELTILDSQDYLESEFTIDESKCPACFVR